MVCGSNLDQETKGAHQAIKAHGVEEKPRTEYFESEEVYRSATQIWCAHMVDCCLIYSFVYLCSPASFMVWACKFQVTFLFEGPCKLCIYVV